MTSSLFTHDDDFFTVEMGDGSVGPVVDALKPMKRTPGRVSVCVDGRHKVTLPIETVQDLGIRKGIAWTSELEALVERAATHDKARRSALAALNRRALARGELVDRLMRKDFSESIAIEVADRMVEAGFVNDEEYGRAVLRELTRAKPAGPMLMRRRLFQKRIGRDLADRLIDEFLNRREPGDGGDHDERSDEIERFVRNRLRSMVKLEPTVRARRIYGLLARRGFDPQTCREYVERLVRADEAGED